MTLRTSLPSLEGAYQAAKYLKHHVLCDREELSLLFSSIGPFWLYPLTGVGDGEPIDPQAFLQEYGSWIEELKAGRVPADTNLRKILAAAMTKEKEALWKQEVPGRRFIVKMGKPLIQIQAHFFTYSSVDEVFRPMTMGAGSIFWGLQFSFPQIYQDAKTLEFFEVDEGLNYELFQQIKEWARNTTRATPFIVNGKRTNVPIRLGKNCFSWIHKHPQLISQKIGVYAE
jgi:hypothetical protein